jgi:hypothetical protein
MTGQITRKSSANPMPTQPITMPAIAIPRPPCVPPEASISFFAW